jgi:hypothetical protein
MKKTPKSNVKQARETLKGNIRNIYMTPSVGMLTSPCNDEEAKIINLAYRNEASKPISPKVSSS